MIFIAIRKKICARSAFNFRVLALDHNWDMCFMIKYGIVVKQLNNTTPYFYNAAMKWGKELWLHYGYQIENKCQQSSVITYEERPYNLMPTPAGASIWKSYYTFIMIKCS